METIFVIFISVIFLFVGRAVIQSQVRAVYAFFIGWGVSFLAGVAILFFPGGSIDNWSYTELGMLLGVFPIIMGIILFVGSLAEN